MADAIHSKYLKGNYNVEHGNNVVRFSRCFLHLHKLEEELKDK